MEHRFSEANRTGDREGFGCSDEVIADKCNREYFGSASTKLAMNISTNRPIICVILSALVGLFPAVANDVFSDAEADAVQAFLRRTFTNGNCGMVVGVLDGKGRRIFAAGQLDYGTDQKVDGDTVFELGSVSKVFTSLLAIEMARRGEVALDDPVAKYLPAKVKLPAHGSKEITLRNLAAQDSGLPWNPDVFDRIMSRGRTRSSLREFKRASDDFTAEDLYAFLAKCRLTDAPGDRFQYSNVGMALLGQALALKAGESYESLILRHIAHPLKMDSTGITLAPGLKARLAKGHWADGESSENVHFQVMASAGGLYSTANDMLKFLSATLGFTRSELSSALEETQIIRHTGSPRFGRTAMPWLDENVYQPPGSELLGHGGGGFGQLAFIGFDRKKRRAVVVLSNQMAVNSSGVGWAILQGMQLSRENVAYFVREIVGIGVALESDAQTGSIRITTVYPESPAGRAGLTVGLVIRKINGTPVEQKSAQECVEMMSGPAGMMVTFELLNPSSNETNIVELTRQKFVMTTG